MEAILFRKEVMYWQISSTCGVMAVSHITLSFCGSAILHDCPEPKEFNPERYLVDNDLPNPKDVIFGFGRR